LGKAPPPQGPGQPPVDNPPPLPGPGPHGGLRVTLSGGGLALALVLIVAVAVAAFFVGRTTAPARTGDKAAAGNHKAGANAPDALATDNVDLPARVPGKQYLVIQRMAGMTAEDWKEAKDIAEWLVKRNPSEPCEAKIIPLKNDKFLAVWSLKPFDSYRNVDAQDYALHLEELGKEFQKTDIYKKSATKYTFSQRHQKKFDPYFVLYKGP
jgi:hypothetical protein